MKNRLFIFAFNREDRCSPYTAYKGHFDGKNFIPKPGFCNSINELYDYDVVQIFGNDGCLTHSPKKFNGDLLKEMRNKYVYIYGKTEQGMLFK